MSDARAVNFTGEVSPDRWQARVLSTCLRHFGGNLPGTWQADATIRIVNAALRNGEPAPAGTGLGVQSLKGRSANVRAEVVEADAGDLFGLSGVLQPDRPFRLHTFDGCRQHSSERLRLALDVGDVEKADVFLDNVTFSIDDERRGQARDA